MTFLTIALLAGLDLPSPLPKGFQGQTLSPARHSLSHNRKSAASCRSAYPDYLVAMLLVIFDVEAVTSCPLRRWNERFLAYCHALAIHA